jgi:drug/metabolite transporter (DMT)-like permease
MKSTDILRLVLLAAIWGGSYALMRVVAPVFGGVGTMWLRIGIAGVALLIYAKITKTDLSFGKFWKQYLFIGLMSSAIPFSLIGFAMKTLPAGYGAMLNATSPFFGALFAAIILHERLTAIRVLGMAIGFVGVGMIVNLGPLQLTSDVAIAAGACVLATASYGYISVYIKQYVKGAPNMGLAACTLLLAAAVTTPIAVPITNWVTPSATVLACLIALALLCSGVAYILYYRLIIDVGPTKAISVTFLIPFFGVLWGAIFLSERLTLGALAGGLLVLIGMTLVLGLLPLKQLRSAR